MLYIIPVLLDILKYFVLYILHIGGIGKDDIKNYTLWYLGVFTIAKLISYFLIRDETMVSIFTGFSGIQFTSIFGFFGIFIATAVAALLIFGILKLNVRYDITGGILGKVSYVLLILFLIILQLI